MEIEQVRAVFGSIPASTFMLLAYAALDDRLLVTAEEQAVYDALSKWDKTRY